MIGHNCLLPGEGKNTYGTGSFILVNTGNSPVISKNGLLTTVGYQVNKLKKFILKFFFYYLINHLKKIFYNLYFLEIKFKKYFFLKNFFVYI